jgi:trimeric autotransporter adhesin
MSTTRWLGRAKAVAQVETISIGGTVVIGDDFDVTINGKTITFTATAGTAANVVAGLVAAMNASDAPTEFAAVTWADATPDITGTADAEGVPFTVSVATDSAAGTIGTTTSTAATGPNHWDNAANWSGGAVPVNGDDVYVDNSAVSILYGLDQAAVTLDSLHVAASFTGGGTIGLPKTNASGYPEYRDDYLAISATVVILGAGSGTGSGRIKLNLGSNQAAIDVRTTGASAEVGLPAVQLLGTHASNTLTVASGSVGVAIGGGEVSTLATVTVSASASVRLGTGCTLTTVTTAGACEMEASATTLTINGGTATVLGAAAITTLNINAGTCDYQSSGTVGTANVAGTLDASRDPTSRTFTTTNMKAGGTILDLHDSITFTNGIALDAAVNVVSAA